MDERPIQILFVCTANKWRSRTAEEIYRNFPACIARSAGIDAGSPQRVTEGLLGWADIIFVMENRHRDYLRRKFPETIAGKRLICLRIPDEYVFNDPDLIDLLKANISLHVPVPD